MKDTGIHLTRHRCHQIPDQCSQTQKNLLHCAEDKKKKGMRTKSNREERECLEMHRSEHRQTESEGRMFMDRNSPLTIRFALQM